MLLKAKNQFMMLLQLNQMGLKNPKRVGFFSFLVKYPQTLIRATSAAFVANEYIYAIGCNACMRSKTKPTTPKINIRYDPNIKNRPALS